MHLYKNFFRLLKRNKVGIIVYAIIFASMLGLLFLVAKMNPTAETEFTKSYHISYVDNDKSVLSKGLIEYLSGNNEMSDFEGKSESSILDIVFFSISEYHMTIDSGFADSVNAGEDSKITFNSAFEMSGSVYGINSLINNYIAVYKDYKLLGLSDSEAVSKAADLLSEETPVVVINEDNEKGEGGNDLIIFQMNQFFCYLALGFMALGVGHTIIANNDSEIGKRIDTSPVPRRRISLTNTAGLFTVGAVFWILFMIMNIAIGGGTRVFREFWWLIIINSFLSMLVACSLSSLITSFNVNTNSLSMITNIVSLTMSFVCGVFVPQSLLGEGVLKAARFLPFYWTVYANNMTSLTSGVEYDFSQLMLCFGMQIMFIVVFSLAAAFVKSSRLNKV